MSPPGAIKCGTPQTVEPIRPLCSWNSPGQNSGVGSHSLLQGIFPTQGLNPGLPHGRQILYHLSHQVCPLISCLPSASGGLSQQTAGSTDAAAAPTARPLAITPQTCTTKSSYTREETGDLRAEEPGEIHDCEDLEPESDPGRAQPYKETLRVHFKASHTAPTPTRCKCSGGMFTPRHSKWQNRVFFLSPISLGQVHLLWTWVLIRCKTEIMPSDLPRPSQKSEDVQQRRKC